MANIVQLKRSSVAGKIPDAANVEIGEPVINLADQVLYTKDGSGTIKVIGAGTTSNISEGTNLYYTDTRVLSNVLTYGFTTAEYVDAATNGIRSDILSGSYISTANVAEYSSNLYFTNARVLAAVEGGTFAGANIGNVTANYSFTVGDPGTTGYRFPLLDGAALQVLQTDGSGQLTFVNLEQASGGGFTQSTLVTFPGHSSNVDYGENETYVGDVASQLSDAFGVSLGSVYDCMEPVGRIVSEDLGALT